jgi:hypothetical protein
MPEVPASPRLRSWWRRPSGSERWTCRFRRWPNGSGSTGSFPGPSAPAKPSMRAGRSPRSGPRSAAHPPPSWCGGWTSIQPTAPCARKARWVRAYGGRPRQLDPSRSPSRPRRPPRPFRRRGGAVGVGRPRLPSLPRWLRRRLNPRPNLSPTRPGPPGGVAGGARGPAMERATTASRHLKLPRPLRTPPRPLRRRSLLRRRHPQPARSAESSSDFAGRRERQAGGSRASMYSMTRRVSCEGVEAPLVTPTFWAPLSQARSRSSSRSTR